MNLNREQFLRAVEQGGALLKELMADYLELKIKAVFSRFGPRSGQCDLTTDLRKIVMEFPEILAGQERVCKDNSQEVVSKLRRVVVGLRKGEPLDKEADDLEQRLLDPELKLYCGEVLIEFRPGTLKYESLRRLQQDARLPPELNEVGSIRVVAGSLAMLAGLSDTE